MGGVSTILAVHCCMPRTCPLRDRSAGGAFPDGGARPA